MRERILEIANDVRSLLPKDHEGKYCSGGFCYAASVEMSRRLIREGIPHELVEGSFDCADEEDALHVWIRFPQYDNDILDITADQFAIDIPQIWFPANKVCYNTGNILLSLEEFYKLSGKNLTAKNYINKMFEKMYWTPFVARILPKREVNVRRYGRKKR